MPKTQTPLMAPQLGTWISTTVNNSSQNFEWGKKGQASLDLHGGSIPGKFIVLLNYYAKNSDAYM